MVLLAAALVSAFLGEPHDTIAIIAIVLLNAGLGFWQEYRSERAMEALQALATPRARVRRGGEVMTVPAFGLVPGDIVLLEAGNAVPADLRIVEAAQLRIDESVLTGESQPADKVTVPLEFESLAVPDQRNMAFKGTTVVAGRGTGVVVRIGMSTELGRVAKLLKEEVEPRTPLQNRLARFAKILSVGVAAICAAVFGLGVARGEEPVLMFMTALSLAVAAIPEALPAVVTVTLALGARAMSRRGALVRKLPAVEALGSVTCICTDKTGTLTENRMRVGGAWVDGALSASVPKDRPELLHALALCNDVTFAADGALQGDPTETALVQAALEAGYDKRELERRFTRVAEIPFSSERGRMSTVHEGPDGAWVFSKGAPERMFPDSPASAAAEELARRGFRVLAVAFRRLEDRAPREADPGTLEPGLRLAGLVGLMDPPRAGAREAVERCQAAGIRVVMITGDHPSTARTIARELGIVRNEEHEVMTGRQLLAMPEDELTDRIRRTAVYARVAPEQKIRIVKALQAAGDIVAMTGDGVNDAPALRRAEVGVSMGKGGTDVAREASHLVLLDDDFSTISVAVQEGRRIYDNVRKFVRFALSGNSGEIWTLFLAPFVGLPVPLLPIHILWVNLVTDGLPGLALALEPGEKDVMRRPPRPPRESIFANGLWQHALWVGILTAAATLGTLAWAHQAGNPRWRSMAFTVLTLTQLGHVLAIRSESESLFRQGVASNRALFLTVIFTAGLQLATLYVPAFRKVFQTDALTGEELLACVAASSAVFVAVELEKWLRRRRARRATARPG